MYDAGFFCQVLFEAEVPDSWEGMSKEEKLEHFLDNSHQVASLNCSNRGIELGDVDDDSYYKFFDEENFWCD